MSDIRQGRFKKLLVPPEQLRAEAPEIARRLAPFFQEWDRRAISDAQLVATWSLIYLRLRHPNSWWGAKRSTPLGTHQLQLPLRELPIDWTGKELELLDQYQTLGDLWAQRAFKGTPEAVHRSLLSWSRGDYPLVLLERVPTVEEVLEQQINGQRCVTIFREQSTLAKLILGERDALGFAFHDLIHADHFFHDNTLMRGQIGFYRQISQLLREGHLAPFMATEAFPEALDYLVADMNSHPVHLWKCFKARCYIASAEHTEALFNDLLVSRWSLAPQLANAYQLLNEDGFTDTEAWLVLRHCESFPTYPTTLVSGTH